MSGGKLKKILPFYAILFAIYPAATLYARLPGGVPPLATLRTFFAQIVITLILYSIFFMVYKSMLRAALMAGFIVFYFSSTGHIFRPLQAPPWTHLAAILFGVLVCFAFSYTPLWEKYLHQARLSSITPYLNLMAVLSLLYPGYRIASVLIDARDDTRTPWTELARIDIPAAEIDVSTAPDIYYIILDGYGRNDALQDVFGYDNSAFTTALEERGFYVASESRSNYIRTVVSLSSSLNMNYINFAKEQAGWDSINYLPLYDLIQSNQARRFLEQAGYTIVGINTDYEFTNWTDADLYLYPHTIQINGFERVFLSTTALGAFYDTEFGFTDELRTFMPVPSYGTRRDRTNFAFDQLAGIPKINGPKFVFAHILAPHPPFVFDQEGKPVHADRPYSPGDGEGFSGDKSEYQTGYVEQLIFINERTLQAVDAILSTSKASPVIIIQGDHGSGSLLSESSLKASCIFERTSILNAYHMPGMNHEALYPGISPVNSFRVVFNTYLGTDLPLLQDKTYYTPFVNPYDFVDVTGQIEASCHE
jgi:hypothetical protein